MTSRGHQVQPLTQAGPRAASSLQQWSQSFLITPWKNDPQHLWATSAKSPSQQSISF